MGQERNGYTQTMAAKKGRRKKKASHKKAHRKVTLAKLNSRVTHIEHFLRKASMA
jgi:hypothetical protein